LSDRKDTSIIYYIIYGGWGVLIGIIIVCIIMGRGCAEIHLFFLFFYSRDGKIRGFSRFDFLGFLSASFYSLFFRPLGAQRRTVIGIDPYDFYNIYWLVNTIISSIK
jgi:hypothetical protein